MKKTISIISSAYNEEGNVRELYKQVKKQMDLLADKYDYEQIVLDNASTDNTLAELRKLAAQDPRFKVIVNARNFGHIRSPYYGILQCQGDAVIYLASDLQDPPSLIPQFIAKWEEGYKVVLAQKTKSKESWLFFAVRRLYYWLLNLVNDSGAQLLSNCTGFGLYDKCVVDELRKLDEPYPYLRGLVCELGYSRALVPFVQPVRKRGITKNNFYTLYDNAMTGFTNHSRVPLRLAALGGFVLGMISFVLALVYLILKLLYWDNYGAYFIGGIVFLFRAVVFYWNYWGIHWRYSYPGA